MGDRFGGIARAVARRPLVALATVVVLALAGAALALRLEPSAATDTLVDSDSETFKDTERFKEDFGDEAVIVLVKGDLQRSVLTADLGRLIRLEGCLSGNVPERGLRDLPPACREIKELKPAKVVYGPGTFINTAASQIADEFVKRRNAKVREAEQAAEAARRLSARRGDPPSEQRRLANAARRVVMGDFTRETIQLALRYGILGVPSVDNPEFVSSLVFDSSRRCPNGTTPQPKSRFAYLFPSCNAALVQVRMRPDLTDAERERAIELFREVIADKDIVLKRRGNRDGARLILTGVPVVVEGLTDAVRRSIFVLLGAALLVMAATLALVFRTRLRLLPLGLALAAAAMTFGTLSLVGGDLTMASIAVLPVLIGLAVDYAIQFQARFDEARGSRDGPGPAAAAERAAAVGGPTIATAGLATGVGFLMLLSSPVPMVRGFGGLLVLGVALALACALTAGFAALVRYSEPRAPEKPPRGLPPTVDRLRESRLADWLADRWVWVTERSERALAYSLSQPRRVLAVGLAVAVVGWAVDTQTDVVSDVRELVPQDLQALKDVNELQEETGVSGEIDVTVRAEDITDPEVIGWMTRFQQGALKAAGYETGDTCRQAKNPPELCPALSLPDIFRSVDPGNQQALRALLDAVPAYFSQGVVTADRRTANLAFGIRLQDLEDQKEVVDDLKARLDPPEGVEASVVGLPVLAAEANGALASPWRRALMLVGALLAVFLVLLAVRRSRRAALVPLIPIALAAGWSAGILFLLGLLPGPFEVEPNPMSITLGALVVAISTEFSVLLSARYFQERRAGAGPVQAIELTYASTGAAVLASGATAIAGFAALVASDIRMLRDFGIVTVVDLTVSLLGVMLVLPAALVWAEQRGLIGAREEESADVPGAAKARA